MIDPLLARVATCRPFHSNDADVVVYVHLLLYVANTQMEIYTHYLSPKGLNTEVISCLIRLADFSPVVPQFYWLKHSYDYLVEFGYYPLYLHSVQVDKIYLPDI